MPAGAGKKPSFGLIKKKKEAEEHLPLRKISCKAQLEGVMTTTDVNLTYQNDEDVAIECVYQIPLEKTTLLSKLLIHLGDQIIETRVETKPAAYEEYDEAIRNKNTAVLAERTVDGKEVMCVKLG